MSRSIFTRCVSLSHQKVAPGPVLAVVMFLGACGDGAMVETTESNLQSFGSWKSMGGFASGVAVTGSSDTRVFIRGTRNTVMTNSTQNPSNTSWLGWSELAISPVEDTPGACAMDLPISPAPTVNGVNANDMHAVIAKRSDGKFYFTLQRFGFNPAVVQAWTAIPNGLFRGSPSIVCGTNGVLVLVGRGLDDRFYVAKNVMSTTTAGAYTYSHGNWTGFLALGADQFVGSPALTKTRCTSAGVVVAGQSTANGPFKWAVGVVTPSQTVFDPWEDVQNGLFLSSPTLAASCPSAGREVLIFGRGFDNQIYSSTLISGSAASFSAVPGLLAQGDAAASFYNSILPASNSYRLIAIENGTGVPKSNSARR